MHGIVGHFPARLRTVVAALAVALTAVFAGASALSVVDRIQHSHHAAHHHDLRLAAVEQIADPALADHHGSDLDPFDRDHQPSAGHQHVDAPLAGLAAPGGPAPSIRVCAVSRVRFDTAACLGLPPDGLERPPRNFATFA